MRSRWIVIGGAVGAALGAGVAYLGVTRMDICADSLSFDTACASPNVMLALLWGVPIGLVVGLLVGLVVSRWHADSTG